VRKSPEFVVTAQQTLWRLVAPARTYSVSNLGPGPGRIWHREASPTSYLSIHIYTYIQMHFYVQIADAARARAAAGSAADASHAHHQFTRIHTPKRVLVLVLKSSTRWMMERSLLHNFHLI
jgi:hypothetical protein